MEMSRMRKILGLLAASLLLVALPSKADAMLDWSPVATTEGLSTFFDTSGSQLIAGSSGAAVGFTSTAAETIDNVSLFLDGASDIQARYLVEVYPTASVVPGDVTTTIFRPTDDLQIGGSDSESQKWLTGALGTTNLWQQVDEATLDVSDQVFYFGTAGTRKRWRFTVDTGGADWPANQRVVGGAVHLVARREEVNGRLQVSYFDGSNTYVLGTVTVTPQRQNLTVPWPEYNPATNLPWTRAQIQALDTGGGAAIQVRPIRVGNQNTLSIFQAYLSLDWVTEDRVAVGTRVLDSDNASTGSWVSFDLKVPNTGADNWSKGNATAYTVLLRRIGEAGGSLSWRWMAESAEMAEALGRPAAGELLPVDSYVPVFDGRGFVSSVGDVVAGRAQTFYFTTSAPATGVDGQPYVQLADYEPSIATTFGVGQEFTPVAGFSPTVMHLLVTAQRVNGGALLHSQASDEEMATLADLTISVHVRSSDAQVGSTTTVTADDVLGSPVAHSPGSYSLNAPGTFTKLWVVEVPLTGVSNLSAVAHYVKISSAQPSAADLGEVEWSVPAASTDESRNGDDASYGGSTTSAVQIGGGSVIVDTTGDDIPLTLSTQPAQLGDFAATLDTIQTGRDGFGCTVAEIDTALVRWNATALGASFERYEVQRQRPDFNGWDTICVDDDDAHSAFTDWEGRRGEAERYRVRQIRTGDYIPSAWSQTMAVTTQPRGTEVVIASNWLNAAVAYERGPDYSWEFPTEIEIVGRSGQFGRFVFPQADRQGDDFDLSLVVYSGDDNQPQGPDTPGRVLFDPIVDFLLDSDVPHFTILDHDARRWYGWVVPRSASRTEDESLYVLDAQCHETQAEPTPAPAQVDTYEPYGFRDDFDRADRILNDNGWDPYGIAVIGTTGPDAASRHLRIVSGRAQLTSADGAGYATRTIPGLREIRIGIRFAAGATNNAGIAVISSQITLDAAPDTITAGIHSVHINAFPNGRQVGLYNGAISAAVDTELFTLTTDTDYELRVVWDGADSITVYDPDGGSETIQNALIEELWGDSTYIECLIPTATTATDKHPRINYVEYVGQ